MADAHNYRLLAIGKSLSQTVTGLLVILLALVMLFPIASQGKETSANTQGQPAQTTQQAKAQTQGVSQELTVANPFIPLLSVKGAIGPATADYLTSEIKQAQQASARLIIITLDTPGGLVSSLRKINQSILASSVPIACLVTPQGARAASAGTYMLYACHIAAMSEATTLGAATPVNIGGGTPNNEKQDSSPSAMEKKVLEDAIAYIRSLAQLRGRNQEWAEKAVREAATLTATEAVEMQVVDLISSSTEELLTLLDGWHIDSGDMLYTLELAGAQLTPKAADWRNQFIATITNPNIAYILMLIGIYGLLLEFYNPGIGISGVTGAICLILALYAFAMLPLNYAGVALIILGIALMALEATSPSIGIFGIGGVIAFILGSIFLFDSEFSQFRVAIPLIAAVSLSAGLFSLFVLGMLFKGRKAKPVSGRQILLGQEAIAEQSFTDKGLVHIRGESWSATSQYPITKGQSVKVIKIDGLVMTVEPTDTKE